MPLLTAAPPQRVPVFSGFDYVAVDAARHRVFAAHTASKRLLIVDAGSSNSRQVDVGPMHGVAVDPQTGDVFTGNGTDQSVSKVDPKSLKVIATVNVPGDVDAITYDAGLHRIYADQDNGSHVFVIDGRSMKRIATLTMPSSDLESPSVDPRSHRLYQNLADAEAFAIVDPDTLKIVKIVKTPQLRDNHPLVAADGEIFVGGKNGVISTYSSDGTHIGDARVQDGIDQCSTGSTRRLVTCAGKGVISVITTDAHGAPKVLARLDTGKPIHTVGIDEATGDLWVVWSDERGDFVQRLRWEQ